MLADCVQGMGRSVVPSVIKMCGWVLGSASESQQIFFYCTEMIRVAGLTELLAHTSCCVWLKVKLHKGPTATDAAVSPQLC